MRQGPQRQGSRLGRLGGLHDVQRRSYGKFHRKLEDTNVALMLISLDHRLQTWSEWAGGVCIGNAIHGRFNARECQCSRKSLAFAKFPIQWLRYSSVGCVHGLYNDSIYPFLQHHIALLTSCGNRYVRQLECGHFVFLGSIYIDRGPLNETRPSSSYRRRAVSTP